LMVGFDDGSESIYVLDGVPVSDISPDLQAELDITVASILAENRELVFQGPVKVGQFDIDQKTAHEFLAASNSSGRSNWDVVRPWINGMDIVRRPRNMWIIDFGAMEYDLASQYELPFEYVRREVKP